MPEVGSPPKGRGLLWGLHPPGLGGLMGQQLPPAILPWRSCPLEGKAAPELVGREGDVYLQHL